MKNIIPVVILTFMLAGCASNNIKSYRTDYASLKQFQKSNMGSVNVSSVTMPEGDQNSIMCRMAGNIYLPNKMHYSEYIKDALHKSLVTIDKDASADKAKHNLSLELTKVNFDTLGGYWYIDADLYIDNRPKEHIATKTKFGTAYIAEIACRNTADSFDEAVANFVRKVLSKI